MTNPLIGLHAVLGELGIVAFIWVFIEMLNPTPKRLTRAKLAAILGVAFFFASWFAGGYYYVNDYGDIKSIIKEGPQPWAHKIFTETKEHVFLFLPFLSIFTYAILRRFEKTLEKDKDPKAKKAVLTLSVLIILLGAMMAIFGYLISSGARTALEAGFG